jgi:dienelactone hydrolase
MITRRTFLGRLAIGAAWPLAGCAAHRHTPPPCDGSLQGFERVAGIRDVLRVGPMSQAAVVLLHELPGLTPADLALAQCLARRGLNVYVPPLFGDPGQDNSFLGYFQSCARSSFECAKPSATSPVLESIDKVVEHAHNVTGRPVGVIGMCLTGIFPLALLRTTAVAAAVVCQPTLPFSLLHRGPAGAQITNLGLGQDELVASLRSTVPFLALRYERDRFCPQARIEKLKMVFGDRVAVIQIATNDPKRHSTLAADHDPVAFADVVDYLHVRLGVDRGPKTMRLARLRDARCEVDADGRWRATG